MRTEPASFIEGSIVEDEIELSLFELCRACRAPEEQVKAWVIEGILDPRGGAPEDWRFAGMSLGRARLAWRLTRDLALNPPGVALALQLLDEIAALRKHLQRHGARAWPDRG